MKIDFKVIIITVFFITLPSFTAYSFDGPLEVKNQFPIFLHANQPYLEKAGMENSLSLSISHSSTYVVQSSGHWVINLDMEITEFNLRYKKIIRDLFELDIGIPVLILSDGFMDGFLNAYHSTFGFNDYGRTNRPLNSFLYEVWRDGTLIIKGREGVGIGDIRVTVKKPLISSEVLDLSIKGDMEFPSGSAREGFGNGSLDAGVSVLLDKSLSDRVMTYWNIGAVFPGDVRGNERIDLNEFFYWGAAIEGMLFKGFNLLVQLEGQSLLYPETELLAVDESAYLFSFGGRYYSRKSIFELSLTEDINSSGAPDFILNFTYKIKL